MWETLVELLNEILNELKGNVEDPSFQRIIPLRRTVNTQLALAEFRVELEQFANQGGDEDYRPETAELRERLRDAAAVVL